MKCKKAGTFKSTYCHISFLTTSSLYVMWLYMIYNIFYMICVLLFLKENWPPGSVHLQKMEEKEWQQVVCKLSSQEGLFPLCLNNMLWGPNDSIPTAIAAVGTIVVVLKGLVENVKPRFAGVWQAQMHKPILAIYHQMLPMIPPAHGCNETMPCPHFSLQKASLVNSGSASQY